MLSDEELRLCFLLVGMACALGGYLLGMVQGTAMTRPVPPKVQAEYLADCKRRREQQARHDAKTVRAPRGTL